MLFFFLFYFSVSLDSVFVISKKRILLKLVLGGVVSVAHFITGHEKARDCYLIFFGVFFASEGSSFRTFSFPLQLMLCCVAALKVSLHIITVLIIFSCLLGIIGFIFKLF